MKKEDENKISDVQKTISSLKSENGSRESKYLRNYRAYTASPTATLTEIRNSQVVGYREKTLGEMDTGRLPNLNVIKSAIDTLTSKIASAKVRPFFNTIQGSFKDIQTVKAAQQYFDVFYDEQKVNHKVSLSFKDACTFDTGCLYINEVSKEVIRTLPHQVYYSPAEETYGKITRVYYERRDFPTSLLEDEGALDLAADKKYIDYGVYYDSFKHVKAFAVNGKVYKVEDYEPNVVPFVFLHYSSPIVGNSSNSVVDMLVGIQNEIDTLMAKIKDASQLTPANTIFVPEGSNVKVSQISNRVGQVIEYKATPNMTTSPVSIATPAFISDQYIATVSMLVDQAYNMVGISQLSAQSQKPTGLDSGIALSTMENIESDRFETQLNQVIRTYVDIAKVCLKVFPKDEDILPDTNRRVAVKWGEIVKESENMSVQFSAADSLSKDPSVKLQQLQQLAQAGVIPTSRISQFMELPDLEGAYSLSNNAINAVMKVIGDCVNDKVKFNSVDDIPDFLPFQMLKEEIINTQLSLKAAEDDTENEDSIKKLTELYSLIEDKEQQWQTETAEQVAMNTPEGTETLPGQENILTQEAAMTQTPPHANPDAPQDMLPQDVDLDVNTPSGAARKGQWNS